MHRAKFLNFQKKIRVSLCLYTSSGNFLKKFKNFFSLKEKIDPFSDIKLKYLISSECDKIHIEHNCNIFNLYRINIKIGQDFHQESNQDSERKQHLQTTYIPHLPLSPAPSHTRGLIKADKMNFIFCWCHSYFTLKADLILDQYEKHVIFMVCTVPGTLN